MNEVYKPIYLQGRLYYVSNRGNIKNKFNKVMSTPITQGYKELRICINYKSYYFRVHRLVAIAFIPNYNNYRIVNHKNGNKLDNRVENLEWCTTSQNTLHSYAHGFQRGKAGNCILTDEQVILIRRLRLAKVSRHQIYELFPEINKYTLERCYYYQTYKYIQREDII